MLHDSFMFLGNLKAFLKPTIFHFRVFKGGQTTDRRIHLFGLYERRRKRNRFA